MGINMQYCRVRNVLAAIRELNEQLNESQGLSAEEHAHAVGPLKDAVEELRYLLDDVHEEDE